MNPLCRACMPRANATVKAGIRKVLETKGVESARQIAKIPSSQRRHLASQIRVRTNELGSALQRLNLLG